VRVSNVETLLDLPIPFEDRRELILEKSSVNVNSVEKLSDFSVLFKCMQELLGGNFYK
jgi:hypothetical protein